MMVLISSLDAQHTDLSGRPAKSEHLRVDQDEALIFFFLNYHYYYYFYCLFRDGWNVQLVKVSCVSWVKHNLKTAWNITATC